MGFFEKIKGFFGSKEIPEKPQIPKKESPFLKKKAVIKYCSRCKKQLDLTNGKTCHYCQKYFCLTHAFPEEHNCKGIPKKAYSTFAVEKPVEPHIRTENVCFYCKKQLILTKDYDCKHCKHWFCHKHRMPEDHKCPHKKNLWHPTPQPTKESLQFK